MRLTSPFADQGQAEQAAPAEAAPTAPTAPAEAAEAAEAAPVTQVSPAAPARPRRTLLEVLEGWLPGVGSAPLPGIATVRAYHKAREYVPWEAGGLHILACVYGWFAVLWVTVFTLIAWAGAGDYLARLRTLWRVGLPGLVRAQLPPLSALSGPRLVWVAWWSAVAWVGLKATRPVMALTYLLAALLPLI